MNKTFKASKKEKIKNFDPSGMGDLSQGIYGLPFSMDEARVAIVPYPWEVTVSSGGGTSKGPEAVLHASYQVDLFDPAVKDAWKIGIAMEDISPLIAKKSRYISTLFYLFSFRYTIQITFSPMIKKSIHSMHACSRRNSSPKTSFYKTWKEKLRQ